MHIPLEASQLEYSRLMVAWRTRMLMLCLIVHRSL